MKNFLILFFLNQISISEPNLMLWDKILLDISEEKKQQEQQNELYVKEAIKFQDHFQNQIFYQLKKVIDVKKEKYKKCINKITDGIFTEDNINKCIGVDLEFFYYDIDYELLKIKGRYSQKVYDMLFENCYKIAGLDKSVAQGCDKLYGDVDSLLWKSFDFFKIINNNKENYLIIFGNISEEDLDVILHNLKTIKQELDEIISMLNEQTDLAVMQIKNMIDLRIEEIVDRSHKEIDAPRPMIFTHKISIKESINPNSNEYKTEIHQDEPEQMFEKKERILKDDI